MPERSAGDLHRDSRSWSSGRALKASNMREPVSTTSIFASSPPWLWPTRTMSRSAGSRCTGSTRSIAACRDWRSSGPRRDRVAGVVGEQPELEVLADRRVVLQVVDHVGPPAGAGCGAVDEHDRKPTRPVRLGGAVICAPRVHKESIFLGSTDGCLYTPAPPA